MSQSKVRFLSILSLAMINIAAIGSVKNWPVTAEYGFSSLFYLVLAAILFFIPASLVAAELATGWPKAGGVFVWVKEAFGHRFGFLAIWLLWFENVIWYPTALSFIGATIAYIFDPTLADNKIYAIGIILICFWGATLLNLTGMRTSSWISTMGAVFGTFLPGILIISLGLVWYFSGSPLQIAFNLDSALPNLSSLDQLVFFTGVILSFCGVEMSAIHARNVRDPQKDYPRAILLTGILIIGLSLLGVLAIASVIPQKEISLVAGSMQAFAYFLKAYRLEWITPYIAGCIALGAVGSLSTWIIGPSRGLLVAAQSGDLPPYFRVVNRHGMPARLLIVQAIIVSLLSLIFLFMPTVSSAFWILTAMTAQLYILMYILLFAAAIKLRYSKPGVPRAYTVPGKKLGIWFISGLGILSSTFAFLIGFFPPAQIETGKIPFYVGFLFLGCLLGCLAPSLILKFQTPEWKHPLSHEKDQ